ncbi:MAG: hypothetical protein JSV56_02095 [Methanomassiliicoccales archaeon]|nr:MAG: hypothetical protein JSV56_02095 [Methanomassiliicoccales archaeon]
MPSDFRDRGKMASEKKSLDHKMSQAKLRLTINDKILLYLLDNLQSKNKREAPLSITQKGIAEGVRIRWNHVPRAMLKLKNLDYVFEEISHIEGKTRRQKVYYLTDEGMLSARNLREKLLGWKIRLKRVDGQVLKIKLSEVNSSLKTNFSLLQLYHFISEDGMIDAEELAMGAQEEVSKKVEKIFFVKGEISWPKELISRELELKTLQDWIEGDEFRTIVIYGSVGIGKSALMAEIIRRYRNNKNIFWYRLSEKETQRDVLVQLSEFFSKLKKTTLASYLKDHQKIELKEIIRIIDRSLRGSEIIIAFDNYYEVSEDVADLFSGLCDLAAKNKALKIIISARDTTPFYCRFYDKREVKKKKIAELSIKGLDKEGIKRLLEAPNIDEDALKKIHLMTRGHPLTIELIKAGDVNSLKRVKGFSRQEASLLLYLKGVEGS